MFTGCSPDSLEPKIEAETRAVARARTVAKARTSEVMNYSDEI